MKKIYLSVILSMGMGLSSDMLYAQQASAVETSKDTKPVLAPENNVDQKEMAAWMIETEQAAKEYVDLLDKGDYAQSWTKGDQLFQHTITQKEWEKALTDSRKKLGKANSRTIKLHRPAFDPHGLPKGPYMVVEYTTSFDNAPDSGELLTMRRGSDGKWRVLTYQVN